MRPDKHLSVKNVKITNELFTITRVITNAAISGETLVSDFVVGDANKTLSLKIPSSASTIIFENYTYGNLTTFFEIEFGIISNLKTTPTLTLYNNNYSANLMNISLGSSSETSIDLNLSANVGNPIVFATTLTAYPITYTSTSAPPSSITVDINPSNPTEFVFFNTYDIDNYTTYSSIRFTSYYDIYTGYSNKEITFTFTSNGTDFTVSFGSLYIPSNSDPNTIFGFYFKNFIVAIQDPDGAAVVINTLAELKTAANLPQIYSTGPRQYLTNPLILKNVSNGSPDNIRNILTYNVI